MRKLMAFRLPPESDEHIVRLQKALDKKMPGKVSKADVVAWALEVTAERLPPPGTIRRRSPRAALSGVRSYVLQRTPSEAQDQQHALLLKRGIDYIKGAAEYWPDHADAAEHVIGDEAAAQRLAEAGPWLARVAELVPVLDPEDEIAVDTPECIADS